MKFKSYDEFIMNTEIPSEVKEQVHKFHCTIRENLTELKEMLIKNKELFYRVCIILLSFKLEEMRQKLPKIYYDKSLVTKNQEDEFSEMMEFFRPFPPPPLFESKEREELFKWILNDVNIVIDNDKENILKLFNNDEDLMYKLSYLIYGFGINRDIFTKAESIFCLLEINRRLAEDE